MHHLLKQIGVEFQKVQNFQHKDSNEFHNRLLNLITTSFDIQFFDKSII